MKNRLNALALAVICGGGAILGHPAPVSATYYNPWTGTGGDYGTVYCCETANTAKCCYANTGCRTKAGLCEQVLPAR